MTDIETEGLKLLQSIKQISNMIMKLQEDIDRTYAMLTSTTVKQKVVDVQTSTPQDPMGEKIIQIVEYNQQILSYQEELIRKKTMIMAVIRTMELQDQNILICRYLQSMTIEAMGEELGYTYRWMWEKLHEAESKFCDQYKQYIEVHS